MPMAIERRHDRPYLVGEPERFVEFTTELLEQAGIRYLTVVDGVIVLTLANATLRYLIVEHDSNGHVRGELIAAEPAA